MIDSATPIPPCGRRDKRLAQITGAGRQIGLQAQRWRLATSGDLTS